MSHKPSNGAIAYDKPKKLAQVYYALIDLSMGDSLAALVSVSTDASLMIGASGFMHRNHPLHPDYAVVRSTPVGYFGGKAVRIAINGVLIKE